MTAGNLEPQRRPWPPKLTNFWNTHSSSADCVGRHLVKVWLFFSKHFHWFSNSSPQWACNLLILVGCFCEDEVSAISGGSRHA